MINVIKIVSYDIILVIRVLQGDKEIVRLLIIFKIKINGFKIYRYLLTFITI